MGGSADAPTNGGAGKEGVQQRHDRMPFSQILAFTVTNLAQGVMLTMPFTVAVYMVRAFLGPDGADEGSIGRVTGMLAAVYSFSQFTTSYCWGIFSSRFGRKPVMILGSTASSLTLLWFGLSGSLEGAAAARVVAGLLNGIIVAWKCAIGESCGALEQGRILSYMSLSWGIGCIVGPSIGGIASTPCSSWASLPGCQPGGLLISRPYFLPCAISAAVNAVSLCLNIFVLRETLPQLVMAKQQKQPKSTNSSSTAQEQPGQGWRQALSSSTFWTTAKRALSKLLVRRPTQYERIDSQLADPHSIVSGNSTSSSSTCGPGCTGCRACWSRWRLQQQSGQLPAEQEWQLPLEASQQADEYLLQPLQHEDSALWMQLAEVKPGKEPHAQLLEQCALAGAADDTVPAADTDAQTWTGERRSLRRQLQPSDSASEYALRRGFKPWGSKLQPAASDLQQLEPIQAHQQQQHGVKDQDSKHRNLFATSQPGSRDLQPTISYSSSSSALDIAAQPSDIPAQGNSPPGSDCTILVLDSPSDQQQQQFGSIELEQPDAASHSSDPLLQQQQQCNSSSSAGQPLPPWHKQRRVVLVLLAYGTVCLLFCAIDELTPIYASAPLQQGGLKLSEVQLAGPLSFSGACLILFSLFAFPAAQRAWGTLAVTRCGLLLAVAAAFAIPCTSFAVPHIISRSSGSQAHSAAADIGPLAWALLYVAMILKPLAGCFAFTGTMILVNTSVADPQQLGAVNGVGQSLASLARGVGPAVSGLLWGVTMHLQGRPGAQLLPFACVASTAVAALLMYAFVQPCEGVEVEMQGKHGTSCCQE